MVNERNRTHREGHTMTGMEHTIEQAARVVDGILSADPQIVREMFGDEPDRIARALADAGLLAPAPAVRYVHLPCAHCGWHP